MIPFFSSAVKKDLDMFKKKPTISIRVLKGKTGDNQ